MGLFSGLFNAAKGLEKVGAAGIKFATETPVLGGIVKALPVVGNIASAADLAVQAYDMFHPSTPGPVAAMTGGGLPALPGMATPGMPIAAAPGSVSGRTGNYATLASRPVMIPQGSPLLRAFVRAPRGYHVFHLPTGQVVAIRKDQAHAFAAQNGLPPPPKHHKPPISVGDWHRFKSAGKVMKKLQKIEHEARHIVAKAPAHFKNASKNIIVRGSHAPGCGCFACRKKVK